MGNATGERRKERLKRWVLRRFPKAVSDDVFRGQSVPSVFSRILNLEGVCQ